MTEPLQVGQFAIVDGEPVDRGPNAGVFHGRGPTDDRAELFILAEGTTPAGEAFAGHVVSAIGQAFAGLDMSLTGSLSRLFHEAERNVRDWNRKSIQQHRVSIGLSAFGRRAGQAVIAQAGPTSAFHLHDGQVFAYYPEGEAARPIGVAPVQPQLTRIPFDAGDRLLLVSSFAARELDDELIAGILALPAEQVLPDLYRRVQQLRQVTVVLVTGAGAGPVRHYDEAPEGEYVIGEQPFDEDRDSGYQPSLFIEDEADSAAAVNDARSHLRPINPWRGMEEQTPIMAMEAPEPMLRASGDSAVTINRLAAEGAARAARSRAAAAAVTAEHEAVAPRELVRVAAASPSVDAPMNSQEGPRPGSVQRARKAQSFSRGLVSPGAPPTRPEVMAEDLPLAAELAAGQRARAARHGAPPVAPVALGEDGVGTISGAAPLVRPRTNMGGRWKGKGGPRRATTGGQLPPAWMVILGSFLALLLLAGIVTVPRMLKDDSGAQIADLMTGAQQRIAASSNQADPAQKRQLLSEAQAMLLAVREKGGAPEAETLISQVAGAISAMDNIQAPAFVETVASLEQFGAKPLAVTRITVGQTAAYLLDVNTGQVVSVPLDGSEPSAVFMENKDEKRGRPVALALTSAGEPFTNETLLIADSANKLWGYTVAGGLKPMEFATPNHLVVSDISVEGGDLFVLDAGQSTIFRFLPQGGGYPNAPIVALKHDDLARARRLNVAGEYLTSDDNGTIHRFLDSGQREITFSGSGIDQPLVSPERVQPMSDPDYVAVLDPANDRIVVLRRDGGYDRQYRHQDFASISALFVRGEEAFIFSGSQLRRIGF